MVRLPVRVSLCVAALMALPAHRAVADGLKGWTVCGGSTFTTCAAVRLNVIGTTVTLSVRNLSGLNGSYAGAVFTSIGLQNVPPGVDAVIPSTGYVNSMSGPTRGTDTPSPWRLANDKVVGGDIWLDLATKNTRGADNGIASNCGMGALPDGGNLFLSGSCGKSGVTNASLNRGWVVLSFDVTRTWDPNAAGTELMVKAVNGPEGAVSVCLTAENCPGASVVPEPITLALLGTGLAGVGGAGWIRRRRRTA